MEDQAEAVDLFTAFAVDLLEPVAHHGRQVGAAQQGADQGPDRGQRRAHLVGEGLKQGQLAAGWMRRLLVPGGGGLDHGLQGDARRHRGEAFAQSRPEGLCRLLLAAQGSEFLHALRRLRAALGLRRCRRSSTSCRAAAKVAGSKRRIKRRR